MVERSRYLLETSSEPVTVLVEDAMTAMQCLRLPDVDTIEQLIIELVNRRVRFSTRIPFAQPHLPAEQVALEVARIDYHATRVGLGWQPPGYTGNGHDARRYLHDLMAWLKTPRACTAVLAGGFYSILVEGMVDPNLVVIGPSRWAREYVYRDVIVDRHGCKWIDDALTDQERDLICGTYWCSRGKHVDDNCDQF